MQLDAQSILTDYTLRFRARLINAAGRIPIVGGMLRSLAQRFPDGSVVTIQSGLAAGMRWTRHHRYVNGYWIGNYEYGIQQALVRMLRPGDIFYDVGANAGFFSVLAAKRVGSDGHVFCFEPLAENIESIREQIEVNCLRHVELVPLALGEKEGTAEFSFAPSANSVAHLGAARVAGEQTITVKVTTIDAFAAQRGAPSVVKIDVEGAETDVLAGARHTILKGTKFLIEIHGYDKGAQVVTALRDANYRFTRLDGSVATVPEREAHIIAIPGP